MMGAHLRIRIAARSPLDPVPLVPCFRDGRPSSVSNLREEEAQRRGEELKMTFDV
jgi:hypothetical protein